MCFSRYKVKGAVAKLFYLMLFVILRLLILKNKLTDPNLDRILVFETLILQGVPWQNDIFKIARKGTKTN